MMTIFLNANGANGFNKWSVAHPPSTNDDDHPGGATPIAIVVPAFDDEPIIAVSEQPHRIGALDAALEYTGPTFG